MQAKPPYTQLSSTQLSSTNDFTPRLMLESTLPMVGLLLLIILLG
ncbi:MAG: hypothetical protein VKK04_09260 [Synechococcales bacterium]|nr:hypothetical protein [Synechococcales bacterium]